MPFEINPFITTTIYLKGSNIYSFNITDTADQRFTQQRLFYLQIAERDRKTFWRKPISINAFLPFFKGQLKAIRQGSSIARVLCDNADGIRSMQPKAFQQITEGFVSRFIFTEESTTILARVFSLSS